MRIVDEVPSTGAVFFRWRSYLPFALVPPCLLSFRDATYPYGSETLALVWELVCLAIALFGAAVRIVTVGTSPRGTSGRSTRRQQAVVLNTTGPYSIVRHPLYVGNYFIVLGLSLVSRTWWLPLMVSFATLLYYERIAAREEHFLEQRFGSDFLAWAARVPAMVPRFGQFEPPRHPFDWRRALSREFYAIAEITTAFFVLDTVQDYVVTGTVQFDPVWVTVFLAGAVYFAVMWSVKRAVAHLKGVARTSPR
jgi:protein-S-isoprenylcysteine O-methyltransferase Ste14